MVKEIDKDFVRRKLRLMDRDLQDLRPLSRHSFDELARENYKYLAMERLLERIINRAVDINTHLLLAKSLNPPLNYRDSFIGAAKEGILSRKFVEKIVPSVGLRNRLVHEYDDLDKSKVYKSVFNALEEYAEYIKIINSYIE